MNASESETDALRAEFHYQRARLALYRARMYGQRSNSTSRLRELERATEGAEARLRAAERSGARHAAEPGATD